MESSPTNHSSHTAASHHKKNARPMSNITLGLFVCVLLVSLSSISSRLSHTTPADTPSHQVQDTQENQTPSQKKVAVAIINDTKDSVTKKIRLQDKNIYVFLSRHGFDRHHAHHLVNRLRPYVPPMQFHKVSHASFVYHPDTLAHPLPIQLTFRTKDGHLITATQYSDASYRVRQEQLQKNPVVTLKVEGVIRYPLARSLAIAGVPNDVARQVIKALSFSVDLQREIRKGDTFQIMYELIRDAHHHTIIDYRLLTLRMNYYGKRRTLAIYRSITDDSHMPFYHASGASVATSLLKTPVDGAFLSSGFGERKDPFSGYTRHHKGTDFGAPRGTPIYAAGDGIVQKMETVDDGYGNYVTIRHDARYRSLYAHMSAFAKNIKPGSHVKQGDIIGYVGTTGYSTGNHLHYEVLVNGNHINSQEMVLPSARYITGTQLMEFRSLVRWYEKIYAELPAFQFASRNLY